MGRAVQREFTEKEDTLEVVGVKTAPMTFVDDVAVVDGSAKGARETGENMTRALDP